MKATKCRVCGKVEWNHVCGGDPGFDDLVESGGLPEAQPVRESAGCPICGGDPLVLSDAEKWRKLRLSRRDYMRRKRADE